MAALVCIKVRVKPGKAVSEQGQIVPYFQSRLKNLKISPPNFENKFSLKIEDFCGLYLNFKDKVDPEKNLRFREKIAFGFYFNAKTFYFFRLFFKRQSQKDVLSGKNPVIVF